MFSLQSSFVHDMAVSGEIPLVARLMAAAVDDILHAEYNTTITDATSNWILLEAL